MKRYLKAAEQPTVEEKLKDDIDNLSDDFDFVISGIEKIAADGDYGKATELVNGLSEMINASIEEMAESISAEAPAVE